ncbi:hypothetical protein ACRRTK_010145 [Alexandromys fortis]
MNGFSVYCGIPFFFFQTGSHYVLEAVLELTIQTNSERSAYLCRTSTGIKNMHHYAWMDDNIFKCQKHFSSLSRKDIVPGLVHSMVASRQSDHF